MSRSTAAHPKSCLHYKYWKAPENARALARAVNACLDSEDPKKVTGQIIVPWGTLNRDIEKEREHRKYATHCAIYGDVEPEPKNKSALLTTENYRNFIQRIIKMRDKNNNGMSRAEVISLTMTLTDASRIQATNHYSYLRQCKMFPELKNHGKTQHAQRTKPKRRNMNTEKLLRQHGTIDEALEEQQRVNYYDPKFSELQDHFMMNNDGSLVVASNGNPRVVGSANTLKHEIITDDNRTVFCCCVPEVLLRQTGRVFI